ncbi:SDR family oxidoreductase [Actinomadura rayongensis]|uniref:SDR family NAD(P)-dependent oxidoreductase n=1 Tax=Actinomadura rayongensis TaxID=1429076 RepID=A0A6I4WB25_9ACTN|nr:SDR family oxidoreductase [Actinomadura rayongensis]MXQ66741.1 SDR family NAD(P)-dependent oxidoreductase [Actinomadura rayongensis]
MKIVLITGANKGIGFATAREIAQRGHTVLLGARDEEKGRAAEKALAGEGDVRYIRLDVTEQATIDAAGARIEEEHGRLDVLVNNAAITRPHPKSPIALPVAQLRAIYETNVFGVVAVTNAMLPLLRRADGAVIGNVSSGLGTMAFLTDPPANLRAYAQLIGYNSSKSALNALTLMYADALKDEGIRVNALSPGFCATDLNNHSGWSTADEGGERIARQVLDGDATGVFLSESGGTYDW